MVLRINRSSLSLIRFAKNSCVRVSAEKSRAIVLHTMGAYNERSSPGRTAPPRSRPTLPCPARPRSASLRPVRLWGIRVLDSTLAEPKTRTYHSWIGSGRSAGRRGRAGQDGTPTEQFAQDASVPRTPQGIEDTSPERHPRSTNKRNLIQTECGNKITG